MNDTKTLTVLPGPRSGTVAVPGSKSEAHRLLICASLSPGENRVICRRPSDDVLATAGCLDALGAKTAITGDVITVSEMRDTRSVRRLPCRESGSTLRFLLPLCGALGKSAGFLMEGRLPGRPLEPLASLLCANGMNISRDGNLLRVSGRLRGGEFSLPGNVSSQYISGLLMALPLCREDSALTITGKTESEGYILLTRSVLAEAGIRQSFSGGTFLIPGGQRPALPALSSAEGDWSGAAFFLCLGAMSDEGVTVRGLSRDSVQGDSAICGLLSSFGARVTFGDGGVSVRRGTLSGRDIDASGIPDLIPVLSVVAAVSAGKSRFYNASRLRLKESDRIASTCAMLSSLGAHVRETEDGFEVTGKECLDGGTVETESDHRIAMSAAVAASVCRGPVGVTDPLCTNKSYPGFWDDLASLEIIK